jgi:hypothetical protein
MKPLRHFFLLLFLLVGVSYAATPRDSSDADLLHNNTTNATYPDIGMQTVISIDLVLT